MKEITTHLLLTGCLLGLLACVHSVPTDHVEESSREESKNAGAERRFKRFASDHPCSSHLVITNPDRRVSNVITSEAGVISDTYLQPGWYRFKGPAGDTMPTVAPAVNSCGTKWPIWLRGSHPSVVGDTVYASACVHHNRIDCFREWEMQVANCGDYFIYRLNNPPLYESAYCAGLESLCPEGTNSLNGFTPNCTSNYPPLTGRVKLRVAHREDSMVFNCDYQGRVPGDTMLEVEWFVEGDRTTNRYVPVWTDRMVERKRSQLTRGRWSNKLGSTVYCSVRAKWRRGEGVPSHAVLSKKHFAGIKVMNESLTVSEALEAGELAIQSTVPVVCMAEYESVCKIHVELEYDADNEEHQQVVFGDCSVELTPENWNKVHKIKVKAVRDFYDDGRKEKIIRFKKIFTTVASDIWNDYQIPDIKIYSSNGKTGLCTSHGDPHMLTFDRLMYHAYKEGEFVLYESTKFPIKVHARMQKCATATCNCAVAVAVQDDVIVVDRCTRVPRNHASGSTFPDGWNTIHAHVLEQGGNFAKGLNVYEHDDGRKYTIHLPTGAYIQFEVMEQWVNIYIHASSDDFNATRGLCGTFDGVKNNDFRLFDGTHRRPLEGESCGHHAETCDFLNSWRVSEADSLFRENVDIKWQDSQILREESFCVCKGDTITCDYQNHVYNSEANYEQKHGHAVTEEVKLRRGGDDGGSDKRSRRRRRRRRRRSVGGEDTSHINNFADDYFSSQFVHNDSYTGELVEKKSESDAKRLCLNAFNSAHMSIFRHHLEEHEVAALLQACIIDVQMTGSEEWVDMTLKQLIAKATSKMSKDRNYLNKNILADVCPQACWNHGRCVNRTCHCNDGWTGSYCGVDLAAAPYDVRLANDGLCDNEVSKCDNIKVFGRKFKVQDNITCIIKHLKGLDDSTVQEEYMVRGRFVNFEQVLVPLRGDLKDLEVFSVAIYVNDHFNFTNLLPYVVYSSKCLDCSVQASGTQCSNKENTCRIEGLCYAAAEADENNCCMMCDPSKSSTQFVHREAPIIRERSVTRHLEMEDLEVYFDPTPPFQCSDSIKITGEPECEGDVGRYLRNEEGNEVVFVAKVDHYLSCMLHVRLEDECSDADVIYHVNLTSKGKPRDSENECSNKPADRDTVQYWDVQDGGLQTKQILNHYPLTADSTFKIQLPKEVEDSVEYISISTTGVISYNVPEYEKRLASIIVTLSHHCGNVERFEVRFHDELE